MTHSILRSQFTENVFRKAENCEHSRVLLLFLFTLNVRKQDIKHGGKRRKFSNQPQRERAISEKRGKRRQDTDISEGRIQTEKKIQTWRKEKAGLRLGVKKKAGVKEKAGFRLGGTRRWDPNWEEGQGRIQTGRKDKAGSRLGGKTRQGPDWEEREGKIQVGRGH